MLETSKAQSSYMTPFPIGSDPGVSAVRVAPAGAMLIAPERCQGSILFLRSGWAMRSRELSDGRRSIIDLFLPGDLVGVDTIFDMPSLAATVALSPVTYQAMAPLQPADVSRNPELAASLAYAGRQERLRVEALAVMLARATAEERISAFLLNLHARLLSRGLVSATGFRLPMTQVQIADHLGLTVVHVNRVLRQLRERGFVSLIRGNAAIDSAGLVRLARAFHIAPSRDPEEDALGNRPWSSFTASG
ncbi:MAG: Crp family transcriptional regulator [Rhodospirillales bacterium]|nr:Crp family transcriptional regulator [Rhodospirillales bacterium]